MNMSLFFRRAFSWMLIALMLLGICAFAEEPAVETVVPEATAETEMAEEPVEEAAVELTELTPEQLEALDNLPEGFSREIVAAVMMQSKGCKHTNFYVWDDAEFFNYEYTFVDKNIHSYSCKFTERHLCCNDCHKKLQTISVNYTITGTSAHDWVNWDTPAENILRCIDCDGTITVSWPCKHKRLVFGEDGNGYCTVCDAMIVFNSDQYYCEHDNLTIYYPNKPYISYAQWDDKQHVKTTTYYEYDDLSWGMDADCNDCGIWVTCDTKGNIFDCGNTSRNGYSDDTGVLENHKYTNGICACGQKVNPTHYSISLSGSVITLTPDANIIELENPMLITNWAYTLRDGTAFSYTRLIKADDLATLTYDLGLAEAPIGSKLESTTVIISDENTLDITVAAKGYGFAQFR